MQYEEISILAGGYSASKYSIHKLPGFVVGVNDAFVYGTCNACVSMDRLWLENRWDFILASGKPAWIRRAALINKTVIPSWMTVFDCAYTSSIMSDYQDILNGTNSGLCAVNLAYQLRPKIIRLYGMDLKNGPQGQRHWYPDYSFKPKGKGTSNGTFANWQIDLANAIKQCRKVGIDVEIMK
jgi:hypothetical protein